MSRLQRFNYVYRMLPHHHTICCHDSRVQSLRVNQLGVLRVSAASPYVSFLYEYWMDSSARYYTSLTSSVTSLCSQSWACRGYQRWGRNPLCYTLHAGAWYQYLHGVIVVILVKHKLNPRDGEFWWLSDDCCNVARSNACTNCSACGLQVIAR